MDQETGECGEQRLKHSDGEAERFYMELKQRGANVRVGMEATGHSRWFERPLAELGFELRIGAPPTHGPKFESAALVTEISFPNCRQ